MLARVLAGAALLLLGADRPLKLGITTGFVATVALTPVWLGALQAYRGAWTLLLLGAATVPTGLWLAWLSSDDHMVSRRKAVEMVVLLVTAFCGVGLILWARRLMPLHVVALLLGAGGLVDAVLKTPGSSNAWKYHLALPTTIMVLAWVGRRGSVILTIIALTLLGAVGITNEYRSYFGFCLLVGVLGLYEARPGRRTTRSRRATIVVLLAGLVAGVYYVGTALLVQGYLGDVLQERSAKQIRESGSLLAGGRPEWTATAELMQYRPHGYGIGTVPQPRDVYAAKEGLATVGVPSNNGYVDNFMFGGQFKLHSVIADLWASAGLVGLLLAGALLVLLLQILTSSLSRRRGSPVVVFLVLNALWDLAFGPIFSTLPTIALAVGLGLEPRSGGAGGDDPPAAETTGAAPGRLRSHTS